MVFSCTSSSAIGGFFYARQTRHTPRARKVDLKWTYRGTKVGTTEVVNRDARP